MNFFQISGTVGKNDGQWINLDNVISCKIRDDSSLRHIKDVTFVFTNGSEAEYSLNSELVRRLIILMSNNRATLEKVARDIHEEIIKK